MLAATFLTNTDLYILHMILAAFIMTNFGYVTDTEILNR